MQDILLTIAAGGFSGAAVVVFLGKLLLNNVFKKSLNQHQHELDIRKQTLQTELTINAEQIKTKFNSYEESKKKALEAIYASVVKTSISRFNSLGNKNFTDEDTFQSEYFLAFSEALNTFTLSFDNITKAFDTLEENAIYIDQETEVLVSYSLSSILQSYKDSHKKLKEAHSATTKLFKEGVLNLENSPLNFAEFDSLVQANWLSIASTPKNTLKDKIRELLQPEGS